MQNVSEGGPSELFLIIRGTSLEKLRSRREKENEEERRERGEERDEDAFQEMMRKRRRTFLRTDSMTFPDFCKR